MARRVGFGSAAVATVAVMASSMALASTPIPAAASASPAAASPWLTLAAAQGEADPRSLCYYDQARGAWYDPARRDWVPAGPVSAAVSPAADPAPQYARDVDGRYLARCGGSASPIIPLAVIAATIATAVYIAASDDDDGDPISPF